MRGVLVTGATTPIGATLVRGLLADPDLERVVAVGIEESGPGLPEDARLHYVRADLSRYRSAHDLLFGPVKRLGLEAVVHLGLHRRGRSGLWPHILSVEATRMLLLLCERHPTLRRFIYRSYGEIYRIEHDQPNLISEDHPLELGADAPQRVRDRVEADLLVATRIGISDLEIAVLRCAEILAPATGSQLWDYLQSLVCFRPLGFDPMLNVATVDDVARALHLALGSSAQGLFNVPGADTLPLSLLAKKWKRLGVPVPGPLLTPLYRLRTRAVGMEFRYDLNHRRFHFSGVLEGARARAVLGYEPGHPVAWPGERRPPRLRPGQPEQQGRDVVKGRVSVS